MSPIAHLAVVLLTASASPAPPPPSVGPRLGVVAPVVSPARRPGPVVRASLTPPRRDFRWEGTALLGAGIALAAGLEGHAYCGNSERGPRRCAGTTIGFGLAGAAVGGVAGHFLGRLISK